MKFVEKLLDLLSDGFNGLFEYLFAFIEFLAKPLSYVLTFFEGIFYFIYKLFEVAIQVILLFGALFQFVFALIAGLIRTVTNWLTVRPSADDVSFPSVTYKGFEVVTDLLQPTGLMTVVPMACLAVLYFFFVIKVIGMFGGSIVISPMGRSGGSNEK